MKQFIVVDPVKVAGEVRKPGDILGADLMTDTLIEQLLSADLIAGYDDDRHTDPGAANPPPGSGQATPPMAHTGAGGSTPPPPPPTKAPTKAARTKSKPA